MLERGKDFEYVKAWKGNGGICANAYHIKVAVRDGKSFWLSSGNWQTSNQPAVDFTDDINQLPHFNREWSLVVENEKLSDIYYKFIDWDFERSNEKPEAELAALQLPELFLPEEEPEIEEVAKYQLFIPKKLVFTKNKPLRIQPVLSPDNYIEQALSIINSATKTLYFQNQYIKIGATVTAEYQELLTTLKDKINDPKMEDTGIILRSMRTDDDRAMLEALQAYGFDMSKVRLMTNTHTKGIIADGERILVGSHNWSNAGVQFNRDASLLIYNDAVAQYYQDVFLHDWDRRTKKQHSEADTEAPSGGDDEAALITDGLTPVNWRDYLS